MADDSARSDKPRRSGACAGVGIGYCLRREKPSPARPKASSAKVPGSGTDVGGSIETGINAELVPRTDRLTLLNENEDNLMSTDSDIKDTPNDLDLATG